MEGQQQQQQPPLDQVIALAVQQAVAAIIPDLVNHLAQNPPNLNLPAPIINLPPNLANAIAAAMPQPPPPQSREPLLRKPDDFTGNKKDYREWNMKITSYIASANTSLNTDEKKIRFVCSYIKEKAGVWAEEQLTARTTNQNWMWNDFTNQMKERFVDKNDKEIARNEIATIQQGNTRAEEFFTKLASLRIQAEYTDPLHDAIIINRLKLGLKTEIVTAIVASGNEPATIEGWRNRVIAVEEALYAHKPKYEVKNSFKPSTTSSSSRAPPPPKPTPSLPLGDPMDIDKMRKEGRCFKCHQKGHLARDCQNRRREVREIWMDLSTEEKRELIELMTANNQSDFTPPQA